MVIRLGLLLFLLLGWVLAAASVHVVRTPANLLTVSVLTKNQMGFAETYVDTRQWTDADVARHPGLVKRLVDAGRAEVLAHVTDPRNSQPVDVQLLDALWQRAAPRLASAIGNIGNGDKAP